MKKGNPVTSRKTTGLLYTLLIALPLTLSSIVGAASFEDTYASMLTYLHSLSDPLPFSQGMVKNTDSLDINIAGAEMEGNIHASIQGTQNLTTNAFQQNLDLNMKLKNTTYYNPFSLDVALKMGLIMKDSNLYLQFNAATGTLVEGDETSSLLDEIPLSGYMNQRISIDGETFLGDIGIQPELLSFQGNLATKQLIETLQQYPIFKLKSTNADGSYNTYLSVANMKKVTEAINPTLLPLIVQLSDSYADTFDNIILKPSEKSLKIILESSDYGEKREILLSEGKIFASYTDPFYEGDNDFYFVYVKGEKGIKFGFIKTDRGTNTLGIFSTKQEQATNAYKVEANGKIQILEDSLELMEILIKYTSLLTPTATTEIIAPSDAISLNELIWGSFDYEDADYGDYDYNDWKEADRYFGGRLDEEEIAETMTDGIVEGDASAPFSIIVWVNKETKEQTTDRALIGTLTQKFGAAVNVVYLLVPADEYSSGSVILNHQSGEYVIVNQQDLTSFQEAVRYLL